MIVISSPKDLANLICERSFSLEDMVLDTAGCEWDYQAKSFEDMGMDAMDMISFIINIENNLCCVIPDDVADRICCMDPNGLLVSVLRQRRLDELGI